MAWLCRKVAAILGRTEMLPFYLLLCTGIAAGQDTTGLPAAPPGNGTARGSRIANIDEPGKPPLKCSVLAEWETPQGDKAYQLQALDSGEMLTIVQTLTYPDGEDQPGKKTSILYHWGDSTTPPPGVPVPPMAAVTAPEAAIVPVMAAPATEATSTMAVPSPAPWPLVDPEAQASINVLEYALYPTQRETAILHLATRDWRRNPRIVQALLAAAKDDPAATVRQAAVAALSGMGVNNDAVTATFGQLKNDADPRVRQEAEQALGRLGRIITH
jgi:hypothetical protein